MPKTMKPPRTPQALARVAPYLNIGGVFVGCLVIGILLGHWADSRWGTEPWMLLFGSLFGMGCGFYHFFKVVLRPSLKKKDDDEDHHDDER